MAEMSALLLRLEGPLQAWGSGSKWVVRETEDTPTLSGVVGILCAALGRKRREPLDEFRDVAMAVRVDREGAVMRDYHTVGAKIGCMRADRKGVKRTEKTGEIETLVSDRYYLADASFLVALASPSASIEAWAEAVRNPHWPPFLGRKSCPPSLPLFENTVALPAAEDLSASLRELLHQQPWRPRLGGEDEPERLRIQLPASPGQNGSFPRADVPLSFLPRRFDVRYVCETYVPLGSEPGEPIETVKDAIRYVDYRRKEWNDPKHKTGRSWDCRRAAGFLCVFCGLPAELAHHLTYEHANDERPHELLSLCHSCHDAVTMIEAERDMHLHRIDPRTPAYHDEVIRRRADLLCQGLKREHRKRRLRNVLSVVADA